MLEKKERFNYLTARKTLIDLGYHPTEVDAMKKKTTFKLFYPSILMCHQTLLDYGFTCADISYIAIRGNFPIKFVHDKWPVFEKFGLPKSFILDSCHQANGIEKMEGFLNYLEKVCFFIETLPETGTSKKRPLRPVSYENAQFCLNLTGEYYQRFSANKLEILFEYLNIIGSKKYFFKTKFYSILLDIIQDHPFTTWRAHFASLQQMIKIKHSSYAMALDDLDALNEVGFFQNREERVNRIKLALAYNPKHYYLRKIKDFAYAVRAWPDKDEILIAALKHPTAAEFMNFMTDLFPSLSFLPEQQRQLKQKLTRVQLPSQFFDYVKIMQELGIIEKNRETSLAYIHDLLEDPQFTFKSFIMTNLFHRLSRAEMQEIFPRFQKIENFLVLPELIDMWSRVPMHAFTLQNFNQLENICLVNQSHPSRIGRLLRQFIRDNMMERRAELGGGIYDRQSTHMKSVHESAAQSIAKLKQRYLTHLSDADGNQIFFQLRQDISVSFASELKKAAALEAIERIEKVIGHYQEPKAAISLIELLFLAVFAIKDKDLHGIEYHDGLSALTDGLYEIERGYNLDEAGKDNMEASRPICVGGSFNKLIEKLQGIHPDAEIVVINLPLFSSKFPLVFQAQAKELLMKLPQDQVEYFLTHLNEDSPEFETCMLRFWEMLKPKVVAILLEEFGSLFKSEYDPKFKQVIDQYAFVPLDEVFAFVRSRLAIVKPAATAFFEEWETSFEPLIGDNISLSRSGFFSQNMADHDELEQVFQDFIQRLERECKKP